MGLTLRQAAEKSGKSRSTIHRALNSGKLSGSRDDGGAWSIDPAELARVFPWDEQGHAQRDAAEQARATPDGRADVLAVKVEMLEAQLTREQETVADLRRRLDRAEERVYLLSGPAPAEAPAVAAQRGLWGRVKAVFSGGG